MSVVLHAAFAALHTVARNVVYWFFPKCLRSYSKSICNLNMWWKELVFHTSRGTLPGGTAVSLGVAGGALAEPSPEEPGPLRAWPRCGTSQRRWPPAPCRTPPEQSRPLVTSCGQCWDGKKIAGNQDRHTPTQPRVWENVQCVYSHGPFRLQAQQAFSDQQKFGSEIWDALDSNHEVPDHL